MFLYIILFSNQINLFYQVLTVCEMFVIPQSSSLVETLWSLGGGYLETLGWEGLGGVVFFVVAKCGKKDAFFS